MNLPPTWVIYTVIVICFMLLFFGVHRMAKTIHAADGLSREARHEASRASNKWLWLVAPAGITLVFFMMMMFGAAGRDDEAAVDAACAKHGLKGYRRPFDRSMCIDEQGNLVAFTDVR